MKQLVINGNKELKGEIKISGAKNSIVALIPAAILSDDKVSLYNVPNISDTKALLDILDLLNCEYKYDNEALEINTKKNKKQSNRRRIIKKIKSIILFYGGSTSKI